ncbi:hypothetical protein swp_3167 [Shewanella piezotolerans WP3]|uniref:Uncharacterized protein n=1 Tax=Shewanella piezotolerans (strain WP3 / JCM 13877) TaxID=225849 RepID=B8CQ12_SHEPW|nr:hypothetical protein swp_3167 [Shewanella piezotolerans WP3]
MLKLDHAIEPKVTSQFDRLKSGTVPALIAA